MSLVAQGRRAGGHVDVELSDTGGMPSAADLSSAGVELLAGLSDAKLQQLAESFLGDEHWFGADPLATLRRWQRDDKVGASLHITAWNGDQPVAVFGWRPLESSPAHLETVTYVCPSWRGTGLAQAIKSLQWDVAKETGRRLVIVVNVRNTRAIHSVTKMWPYVFTQTVFHRGFKGVVWDVSGEAPIGHSPSPNDVISWLAPMVVGLKPAVHRQRPGVPV